MPSPLTILLAEAAERPFLALPELIRSQLRRILERVAALAALAPPIDPVWRKIPSFGAPLMRFQHNGVELFYELDLDARTLRITSVRPADEVRLAV